MTTGCSRGSASSCASSRPHAWHHALVFLTSLVLLTPSTACKGGVSETDPAAPGQVLGEFISISVRPDGGTIAKGDSLQLVVSYHWPRTPSITWASNDSSVAEVSPTGMVYGRKPGLAGVRVIVSDRIRGAAGVVVVAIRVQ